jgi:parallel beta-helix repeat protein
VFLAGHAMVPDAQGATRYVGKSSCGGAGTSASPYCTIQQGLNSLKAGDTLLIRAGTYKEQLKLKTSGTAAQPIVIQAAPGAKPVIDGSGESFWEEGLIHIDGKDHVTLRGLTVRSSPYYCIQISGASGVTIDKLVVDTCEHGGIVFDQGCDNAKVLSSEVKGTDKCGKSCGTHEAITFSETNNFVAAGNYLHHGVKEGIDAKDGSSNGLIYNNTVANMGQVGIYLNHCTKVKVYKNRVHDNGASAFQIAVGDLAMNAHVTANNEIYQNEAWNNAYCGIEFWSAGSGRMDNNKIYNNVFYNNSHYGVQLTDSDSKVYGNIFRNNIIVGNKLGGVTGDADSANTISHNLFHNTGASAGTNKVTGDPAFVNAAGGDFHLKAGSPAINAGYDMGLPKVGQQDIGAHEFGWTPPKLDAGPPQPDQGGITPMNDQGLTPRPDGPPLASDSDGGAAGGDLTGGCSCEVRAARDGWAVLLLTLALTGLGRLRPRHRHRRRHRRHRRRRSGPGGC